MSLNFYADLVPYISAHLYRIGAYLCMPKFKWYAHLDILLMTAKESLPALEEEEAHYYQAKANACYRNKAYKEAYQHQKRAMALFETSNPHMVPEANQLCHMFVKQAVTMAKNTTEQ